jgi:hypothetical protein
MVVIFVVPVSIGILQLSLAKTVYLVRTVQAVVVKMHAQIAQLESTDQIPFQHALIAQVVKHKLQKANQ